MRIFVGCDLGGTEIKAGLVNIDDGSVLISDSIPTLGRQGPDAVLRRMAELIRTLIDAGQVNPVDVGGVGISAPGIIDLETNTTRFMPNLHTEWRMYQLASK